MVHISFLTQNHSTQERDSPYLTVFIGRLLYNTFWFVLNILDLNSFWFSCLVFTFLWKLLYNLFILAVPDSLLCYIPFVWLQCFVYLSDSKVQPNGTWIMIHHEVLNFQDWILFFLIGIHPMQGWTDTTRHGVTRKKAQKGWQDTENGFRKNLQLKDVC